MMNKMKKVESELMEFLGFIYEDCVNQIPTLFRLIQKVLKILNSPKLIDVAWRCGGLEELNLLERRIIVIQQLVHRERSLEQVVKYESQLKLQYLDLNFDICIWLDGIRVVLNDTLRVLLCIDTSFSNLPRSDPKHKQKGVNRSNDVSNQLDKISLLNHRLDQAITDIRKQLKLPPGDSKGFNSIHRLVKPSRVFGREKDEKLLLELLLLEEEEEGGKSSKSKLLSGCCNGVCFPPVLPILADGGFGKTTLAQLVYNNFIIQNFFDIKMWVCVPVIHDTKSLTQSLLECATGETTDDSITLDNLQLQLEEVVSNKKIFLVLDDVFSELFCDWYLVLAPFRSSAQGSRILLTTQSRMVCSTVGTVPPFRLQPLPYEDCWSLFKDVTYGDKIPKDQLPVCKEMVKVIQGFPSMLVALGNLLRCQYFMYRTLRGMRVLSAYRKKDDGIWLTHMKQCFNYFAVFFKDTSRFSPKREAQEMRERMGWF